MYPILFLLKCFTLTFYINRGAVCSVAAQAKTIHRRLLNVLVNTTCHGEPVSSLYGCVQNGLLCSDNGTCVGGACSCYKGRTGQFCQILVIDSKSSSNSLAIALGKLLCAAYTYKTFS